MRWENIALHSGIQRCEFELAEWEFIFIIKHLEELTIYEEENIGPPFPSRSGRREMIAEINDLSPEHNPEYKTKQERRWI